MPCLPAAPNTARRIRLQSILPDKLGDFRAAGPPVRFEEPGLTGDIFGYFGASREYAVQER